MHGADVIHIESPKRPDPIRFNTIKSLDEDMWWEWSPLYHGPNFGKRDLTLDMSSDRGRALARDLVGRSDIVVENFSPRVMESWGLGYDDIKAVNPTAIVVRAPAFGISGPWRDRTGYAQTMEMASGLAWLTGWPDAPPEIPNGPMGPVAGGHATVGLLVALEHRRRTGEGSLVEAPMIGGALNIAAELVIAHSAYGVLISRTGNRSPDAAPQGAYRCAGESLDGKPDRWVFVSVETDAQWAGLRRTLGDPEWARDPRYDTAAGRHDAHDDLDAALVSWCAARGSEEIVDALLAAGVPATRVLHQHEPGGSPQERFRGFFETVEHPVTGPTIAYAYPAWLTSGPARRNRSHAPLLGEHNAEVLTDVLGLSLTEVAALGAEGVIGTSPTGGGTKW
jgi:crotonobetainyl-CoA:carnitine CoA-transferase CaiB-like acyl-CoA transferase